MDHPAAIGERLADWYRAAARPLPWRAPGVSPWGVLVSEVMLQQTPVARVAPAWAAWLERWPNPAALAADPPGEAVRAWGRLGYPRRALRLHAAASVCVESHGGHVPDTYHGLRALPGVGDYTAAAVLAFAYGQRAVVLDTNVRRVHARLLGGQAFEPAGAPTRAERDRAEALLPAGPAAAAEVSVAVMELGAVICSARSPSCAACPVAGDCAWLAAGQPAWHGPPRRGQSYAGTDRQARGALLAVLRDAAGSVPRSALEAAWAADPLQRERALDSLVADGLVEPLARGRYRLPLS
jgi:A/G-specific adenine glycosylase